MFANLTASQLAFLTTDTAAHRLDKSKDRTCYPNIGPNQHVFETLDACRLEDAGRADALQKLKRKVLKDFPNCDINCLAKVLRCFADTTNPGATGRPNLASATYVRDRRIGILGAILDLMAAHPTLDMAWVTAKHQTLSFSPAENWSDVTANAKRRLQYQMEVCGAVEAAGFLIACLTGYFDPRFGKFWLEFRGVAGGEKFACIRRSRFAKPCEKRPHGGLTLGVHRIRQPMSQIVGMMPNYIPELIVSKSGSVEGITRMSEPHHSIYLLWLDQRNMEDMWVTSGVRYYRRPLLLSHHYEESLAG